MPLTTTTAFPDFNEGDKARASDVKNRDAWGAEGHHWPHNSGTTSDDTYDLGQETAHWRYGWFRALNPTSTARPITVGTTTSANDSSTAFEIAGSRAFIVPRMTGAQRTALTGINGMVVYDSDIDRFQVYEDGGWVSLGQPIQSIQRVTSTRLLTGTTGAEAISTHTTTIASVTTAKAFVLFDGATFSPAASTSTYLLTGATTVDTTTSLIFNGEISGEGAQTVVASTTVTFHYTVVEYT